MNREVLFDESSRISSLMEVSPLAGALSSSTSSQSASLGAAAFGGCPFMDFLDRVMVEVTVRTQLVSSFSQLQIPVCARLWSIQKEEDSEDVGLVHMGGGREMVLDAFLSTRAGGGECPLVSSVKFPTIDRQDFAAKSLTKIWRASEASSATENTVSVLTLHTLNFLLVIFFPTPKTQEAKCPSTILGILFLNTSPSARRCLQISSELDLIGNT